MNVKLIYNSPLEVGIEHLTYSFDIDGISRALLQELCRHRISSYTVKSSRYTLQELKDIKLWNNTKDDYDWEIIKYFCVLTGNKIVDINIASMLTDLQTTLRDDIKNDIAKYCMPEAYKTSLVMTINARALQNFLELRSSKHALWEIQKLAKAMYEVLPENHKFLFDYIYEKENTNGIN